MSHDFRRERITFNCPWKVVAFVFGDQVVSINSCYRHWAESFEAITQFISDLEVEEVMCASWINEDVELPISILTNDSHVVECCGPTVSVN